MRFARRFAAEQMRRVESFALKTTQFQSSNSVMDLTESLTPWISPPPPTPQSEVINSGASSSPALGTIYFVDFENVHSNGLQGAKSLTSKDAVLLFYTDGARSIDVEVLQQLTKSTSKVEWLKSAVKDQQADKALLTRLGYEVGKRSAAKYVVVSGDGGFKSMISMLRGLSQADVSIQKAIVPQPAKPSPQPAKPKPDVAKTKTTKQTDVVVQHLIRNALIEQKVELSKINAAIARYQEIRKTQPQSASANVALQTCIPKTKVKAVYAKIKPHLK